MFMYSYSSVAILRLSFTPPLLQKFAENVGVTCTTLPDTQIHTHTHISLQG